MRRENQQQDAAISCRSCGHWMGRSRIRFGRDGCEMSVRCGKCKTIHEVKLGFGKLFKNIYTKPEVV